jgi:predicted nucleic acid-binding protein
MSPRVFVDTNVWVYAVDDGAPDKQERARAVLAPEAGSNIVLSAQVLGEFYVTVRRRFADAVSDAEAAALVDRMRRLAVVPIDAELVSAAIAGSSAWRISYWDALIVSAATSAGCHVLLSEDLAHGAMYGSVRVKNPFEASQASQG